MLQLYASVGRWQRSLLISAMLQSMKLHAGRPGILSQEKRSLAQFQVVQDRAQIKVRNTSTYLHLQAIVFQLLMFG